MHIGASLLSQVLAGESYTAAVLALGRETTDLGDVQLGIIAASAMKKRARGARAPP